jgi:hypothetical protein
MRIGSIITSKNIRLDTAILLFAINYLHFIILSDVSTHLPPSNPNLYNWYL